MSEALQTKDAGSFKRKSVNRKVFSFHGGIHPEENKSQSAKKDIAQAAIPPEIIIPLQQHIGAPAKPVVEIGERVLKGQLIAAANGFVSVPVHASTSGIIKEIGDRPVQHPSGLAGKCIVIESDGNDEWCVLEPVENFQSLEKSVLLEKIRQAGIAGMGGAGFPSVVKLGVKDDTKIETLILNSVECEPYITADDVLIQNSADEILKGLAIIAHLVKPNEILIGIEDNKPDAIKAYEKAIEANTEINAELVVVPTKYPSGGEKQLIQLLTGKQVPSKGLPSDEGIVCQNTGTALAIYEAISMGKPLISRVTTLTGKALSEPQNYYALIGTPFHFLLEAAGVNWQSLEQLVMGGPMMGFSVSDTEVPVVKTTNCILASAKAELTDPSLEQPCIRCGSCAEVCPATLLPQQLYWYSKSKELEKAEDYNLSDCIECGACSYVCPSNIPLVQYFRFAKGEARKKAIELEKSEQSRERFEARKARLEREEAEREQKRKAKAEARKQKKAAAKPAPSAAPATDELAELEKAVNIAKTQVASSTKQWKEAEKALQYAENNNEENIEELRSQVESLKTAADDAQGNFKQALAAKKAYSSKPAQAGNSEIDQAVDAKREESSDASQNLKSLKKALLSAKTGTADTSELEAQVAQAKEASDKIKAELRELLQKQKEQDAPSQDKTSNENIDNKQSPPLDPEALKQLKIDHALAKVQLGKLYKALKDEQEKDESDEQTCKELEQLIESSEAKLAALGDTLKVEILVDAAD